MIEDVFPNAVSSVNKLEALKRSSKLDRSLLIDKTIIAPVCLVFVSSLCASLGIKNAPLNRIHS